MQRIYFYLIIFILCNELNAQTIDTTFIEITVENNLENISNEESNIFLKEELQRLMSNPLNINYCTKDELLSIPFLPPEAASLIVKSRKKQAFTEMAELKKLLNNDDLYQNLLPFVTIIKKTKEDIINYSTSLANTMEKSRGYDSVYPGYPVKMINKLQFNLKDYNLVGGFLIEKDPGEKYFTDFYSGHLNYRDNNYEIIFGDYLCEMGQGLCIGMPYSLSKSGNNIASVKKQYNGIKPYFSSAEFNFMRGLAAQTNINNINIMMFFSKNKLDASVDSNGTVGSLIQTGYHRTSSELNKRNNVTETIFGGKLNYRFDSVLLGINFYRNTYDRPLELGGYYAFRGDVSTCFSFDYKVQFDNCYLLGEIAKSGAGSIALLSAIIFEVSDQLNFSLLYRKYPENFINLHSSSFSEGETRNEEGVYFGLYYIPINYFKINAYYDIYKFPYRTYFNPLPTSGKEFLITADFTYFRNNKISIKYKNERKEGTADFRDEYFRNIARIVNRENQSMRLEVNSIINRYFRVRGRIELSKLDYPEEQRHEKGILIFNDINFKPIDNLLISGRVVFFESDSYYSRIYEYESEITGIYNNISLDGRGERMYIMVSYEMKNFMNISFKYSYTFYDGEKSIGTGYDEIKGNVLNKISFSLNLNF
jgi:hypothetical protein